MLTTRHKVRRNTITARVVNGTRVKVWVARNIAGDYYASRYKIGRCCRPVDLFRNEVSHHPVVRELVHEYAVAKRQGRG